MKKRYDMQHLPQHFNFGDYVYLNPHNGYEIPQTKSQGRKLAPDPFKVKKKLDEEEGKVRKKSQDLRKTLAPDSLPCPCLCAFSNCLFALPTC
jgi:hypothetical protein